MSAFTDDRLRALLAFPPEADVSAVQAAVRGLTAVTPHAVQAFSASAHRAAPAVTDAAEDAAFAVFSGRLGIPTAAVNPQGHGNPGSPAGAIADAEEDAAFAAFSAKYFSSRALAAR